MQRYGIVNTANTVVENICVWDGSTPWTPPDGCEAVLISDDTVVAIGYLYIDGSFVSPLKPIVPPLEPVEAP